MANGFRNLQELREAAPAEMRSVPDDVLICDYAKDAEVNSNYAAQFFKPELVPLNCEEVLHRHAIESYELVVGFFPAATIAITLLLAGYFIWKQASKFAPGDTPKNTGIRWASFGAFMAFATAINLILNSPLLLAAKVFLTILFVFPSALFAIGFSFQLIKSKASLFAESSLKNKKEASYGTRDSEEIWERISKEMDGEIKNKALWAKSFAEANGNLESAKATYMKSRYDQLAANQKP